MVFDNKEEMEKVWGRLEDNSFILMQEKALKAFKKNVNVIMRQMSL